jgi:anti-sigma factor (TIGR02949 family)
MTGREDDCKKAARAVYDYLDGQMGWWRAVGVRRHLHRCRGCADAVEFERAFLLRIRTACPEQSCPELEAKVRELLRHLVDE